MIYVAVFGVFFCRFLLSFLTIFMCFFDVFWRPGKGARGVADPQSGYAGGLVVPLVVDFVAPQVLPNFAQLGAVACGDARQKKSENKIVKCFFRF